MSRKIPTEKEIYDGSVHHANNSEIGFLGTIDKEGYPNIKAVIKAKNKEIEEIWINTGSSSEKVSQIEANNESCFYFTDFENFKGLMLLGKSYVKRDTESRELLWNDGYEQYFPLGIDDPEYTVLHFVAEIGRYYNRRRLPTFKIPFKKK